MTQKAKASLPRTILFKYYGQGDDVKQHQVRKLPLGKSVELSSAIEELPKALQELMKGEEAEALFSEDVKNMDLLEIAVAIADNLEKIMTVALDSIITILEVGSGLDRGTIEELALDEASELFLCIIQVNNLQGVQANLKNAISLLAPNAFQKAEKAVPNLKDIQKTGSKT